MAIMKLGMANPNLPLISAAFFHSTPHLSMKKRVYWPLKFKLVFKNSQFLRIIGNCYDEHSEIRVKKTHDYYSSFKDSREQFSSNSSRKSLASNISNRQALGLKATGLALLLSIKLKLHIDKSAMKWHPDHHQGPGKALAETHFKKINAARESLCNEISKA